MTLDLPAGLPQVVRALVDSGHAWITPRAIAELLGFDPDNHDQRTMVECRIGDLVNSGWLELIDRLQPEQAGTGQLVMLTPAAMQRLGLDLGQAELGGHVRYLPTTREDGECEPVQLRGVHRDIPIPHPELVPDPLPEASVIAEEAEEQGEAIARAVHYAAVPIAGLIDFVPWPTVIYCGGPEAWYETDHQPCADCRRRDARRAARPRYREDAKGVMVPYVPRMPRDHCCARCLRWGRDHQFGNKPARRRGRPVSA